MGFVSLNLEYSVRPVRDTNVYPAIYPLSIGLQVERDTGVYSQMYTVRTHECIACGY